MNRFLCPSENLKPGALFSLPEDEATHASSVLRLSEGDLVEILDGHGRVGVAKIEKIRGKKTVSVLVKEVIRKGQLGEDHWPLRVFVGLIKPTPLEWLAEKLTEIGVSELTVVASDQTGFKVEPKKAKKLESRLQRISDQALKQSGRSFRLKVHVAYDQGLEMIPNSSLTFLAVEPNNPHFNKTPSSLPQKKTLSLEEESQLLIGPVGGWSERELDLLSLFQNLVPIQFGKTVLRTETAALYAVSNLIEAYKPAK